ncbi:MAG: alpha-1,2-fucosyltransferase [Crocinitomicaceae bacterium]
MIYIKIRGGLGNQMFQFAAAVALSKEKKTTIGIETSEFLKPDSNNYTSRVFELGDVFNLVDAQIVSKKSYNYLIEDNFFFKLKRKLFNGSVFYETNLAFDPTINKLSKNGYIEGYFQSEKYFLKYRESLLSLFTFSKKPSIKTTQTIAKINKTSSIAIHIRRGDYQKNREINNVHGVLPLSYYEDALKHFDLSESHLLFFSDDIDWVKESFNFLNQVNVTYVNWNTGKDSWQDLFLMSNCKHFIIANSSFSWWGAWLSTNENKTVICPKQWFADKNLNKNTSDLIPKRWIRI